jgi:hypothetical protein
MQSSERFADRQDDLLVTSDELSALANQALSTLLAGDQTDVNNAEMAGNTVTTGAQLVSMSSLDRDLLNSLGDSFEADLFSAAEDAFRLGLNPLEVEELEMLSNSAIVADPETEDSFKFDHHFSAQ